MKSENLSSCSHCPLASESFRIYSHAFNPVLSDMDWERNFQYRKKVKYNGGVKDRHWITQ